MYKLTVRGNFQLCICMFYFLIIFMGALDIYNGDFYDNSKFIKEGTDGVMCDDFIYGCCKIYDSCQIVNDRLESTFLDIDPTNAVCEDEKCSNCPRLYELIRYYNHYMENLVDNEKCENGQYLGNYNPNANQHNNCSVINTACDTRYYWDVFRRNQSTHIDLYLLQATDPRHVLNRFVYHNYGKKTHIYDIWMFYNDVYIPETKLNQKFLTCVFFSTVILICLSILNCMVHKKKPKEYQPTGSSDKNDDSVSVP